MATYAIIGTALEQHLGWNPSEFMQAYRKAMNTQSHAIVENHPVFMGIVALFEGDDDYIFKGTATELYTLLKRLAPEDSKDSYSWPKNAQQLSIALRRLAPNLREEGFVVEFDKNRGAKKRPIVIHKRDEHDEQSVKTLIDNGEDNYIAF